MSAPEAEEEPRRTVPLKWLTWGGLGLAPLAALLLLLGDGDGSLRLAMVIAIASVVLIGLSITLRGGVETMRADMEDALVEEMDVLRDDVRNDISTAVRATHRAFGEKMQVVQGEVEALRGQMDAVRGEIVQSESGRAQPGDDRAGYDRFDQAAPASAVPAAAPASGPTGAAGYDGQYGGGQYNGGQYGSGGQAGRASVPAVSGTVLPRQPGPNGVVRRTETVQVTTRQVVDPRAEDEPSGTVYGGTRYGGRGGESIDGEWSAPPARGRRSAEPDEESWSERRLRDQPEDRWSWSGDRDDSAEQRYGDRPVDRWDVGRVDGYSTGSPAERWPPARDDDYPPARDDDFPPARSGAGARNGRYPQDRADLPGAGGDRAADEPPWRDARWGQRMADAQPDGPGSGGTGRRAALPALPAGGSSAAWSPPARDPLDDEPVRRSRRYRDDEADVGRRFRDDDPPRRFRDEEAGPGRRSRDDASGRRSRDDDGRRYGEEGTAGRRYRDYDDDGGGSGRRYRDYDDGGPGRRYRDPDDGGRRYRDDDGRGRYHGDVDHPDDRRWR